MARGTFFRGSLTPASDIGNQGKASPSSFPPCLSFPRKRESKRWKTSSRVRIGFGLPCHSKAFQKSRTAAEEGSSVSSGVAPWIPAKAGMTARAEGMMGREREMTAWRSGPLIQNGVNGNLPPQPYGKGWTARMAGYRRNLSTALPQRRTRPWGLSPAPYPNLGL